ncbi:unnamed protein product [Anisakis simplex]|uniref:EGF-like domain-containing protein n=1 Tax=Anisakis simplex TaxID=6269 RepID=A0A0M3JRA6_ANISI|nr:unnamed protein product [Anisakis simplex]
MLNINADRRIRLVEECPIEYTGYCLNGGGCIWDGTNAASCFCVKGFSGKRCERLIPSMPVTTSERNLTSLTIFIVLLSVVLLIGAALGIVAIRYHFKRSRTNKSSM